MTRLILLCLLLSACSTTTLKPQAKYYLLDSLPASESNDAKRIVAINSISMPAYLDQPNLLMRQADQQIIMPNDHRWAGNLRDSVRRVLRAELNRIVRGFRFEETCQDCGGLTITIRHFYPTDAGEVFLAGSYSLIQEPQQAAHQVPFSFRGNMREAGYGEAVNQMRLLLLELSQHIRRNFEVDVGVTID
ncbi:MAG: putative lipoprotein YmbA [Arenicella sp.]|jgi:uncharacterized lipoprotein YmbA